MARPGRRPKPTALRILDGDRKSRINVNEPRARPVPPECPPEVSAEVRAVWDYTVGELEVMGIAFAADRDVLRCYCEAVVTHRRACDELRMSPLLLNGALGGLVRNPAVQIQRDAAATIRGYAAEFGLSPSARSRIENKEPGTGADDNPFSGTGS